jgi:hypothetical protein
MKFTVAAVRESYEEKLSADGTSAAGNWTQGRPLPLELPVFEMSRTFGHGNPSQAGAMQFAYMTRIMERGAKH